MKTEKLYEGQVFKNYRVLCEELEMPVKTSNAKKAQMKELKRYCKIQQVGHSLTVVELYLTPLEKVENRGRAGVYGDLMKLLIADYLIESGKTTVLITRNNMLKNIDVVNKNYAYGSRNVKHLSKYTNVNQQTVYDFYNTSSSNFRAAFETALSSLRNQSLIIYDTVTVVFGEGRHRVADEEEREIILSLETKVLEGMGYKDISSVRVSSDWNKFKRILSNTLLAESKIEYYYTSYEITVNRGSIKKSVQSMLNEVTSQLERREKKNELNSVVYERLLENAEARRENSLNSSEKGKMSRARESFSYLHENRILADLLIKTGASDITRQIEDMKKEEDNKRK